MSAISKFYFVNSFVCSDILRLLKGSAAVVNTHQLMTALASIEVYQVTACFTWSSDLFHLFKRLYYEHGYQLIYITVVQI